jgi:FAD dependent oxidoreductase
MTEPGGTARSRQFRQESRSYEVVVVGGGMAGIAAALTAAREGAETALVHDRPVLGGNASTEIRVNLEGANGGHHNRFFVESGIAEDLLLLNFWRNPTGAPDHWGALLLDLVLAEPNLTLYLDTFAREVEVDGHGRIAYIGAETLASERGWRFAAPFVVDATGDGTIAALADADSLYGEDSRELFDEPLAPGSPRRVTLGGTMQFMCVDTGRAVVFEPPAFARKVTTADFRTRRKPNVWEQDPVLGGFWWLEYGGELDTISDNADIKLALLAEVYGVWDYVKNSPELRERNANLDLIWVAALPGKRESRRVLGDHVLTEHDVMESRRFDDAVAYGGWSIDWHPPGGFMDFDTPPCIMVHPPAVYQIPLRSLHSRTVPNLLLAGRDISASHVAHCSARVMLTCTHIGEAVGAAAAACVQRGRDPREIAQDATEFRALRVRLEGRGHHIPYVPLEADRPPPGTVVTASSAAPLAHPPVPHRIQLDRPRMVSLPVGDAPLDAIAFFVDSARPFRLSFRVYAARDDETWLPGEELGRGDLELDESPAGAWRDVPVHIGPQDGRYLHIALASDDPEVQLGASRERPLGPISWWLAADDLDEQPVDRRRELGWESPSSIHSFWRRDTHGWGGWPGSSVSFFARPSQTLAAPSAVLDPFERPTPLGGVHAWVSSRVAGSNHAGAFLFDEPEWLELRFPEPIDIERIDIYLNSDLERHLANIWYSYPPGERAMTTVIRDFEVAVRSEDDVGAPVLMVRDNFERRRSVQVHDRIGALRITCHSTHGEPYASIQDVRVVRAV